MVSPCRSRAGLKRACGLLLLIATGLGNSHARTLSDEEASWLPLEALVDVEIASADKYIRKLSGAASSAVVVDAEDIRRHGYRNLADLLQTLPGLYVTNDRNYSYLGSRGVGLVGDWNSRILFLVDGHRINENVYDGAYIGHDFIVDLALVDRVEYVAGPAASMFYGNNAFFGVVNVITKTGKQIDGGRVDLSVGSHRAQKQTLSYGKQHENGLDVVISASRLDIRGQDLYIPEFNGVAPRGDYEEADKFFTKVTHGEWSFQFAHGERKKGIPNAPYLQVFFDPRNHSHDAQTFASLQFNRQLESDALFSAKIYQGQYDYSGDYIYADNGQRYINRDVAKGRWQGGEVKYVSATRNGHQWLIGAEYRASPARYQRNFDIDGATILDDRRSDQAWAVYGHDTIKLKQDLTLDLGLRYDRPPYGQGRLNPRFGLIYDWRPETTLKLLYGSAFRSPNVSELHYDINYNFLPNPQLRAETIRSLEAQLEHRPNAASRWLATLFENRINGLVSNVYQGVGDDGARGTADDVYRLENSQQLHSRGLELRYEQQLDGGRFNAAYTLQQSDFSDGSRLENSPRHLAKLNWRQPLLATGIHWALGLQYIGPRQNYANQRVAGAVLGQLAFSGRLTRQIDWSLAIFNLLDRRYNDPAGLANAPVGYVRQDGRTVFFNLGIGF